MASLGKIPVFSGEDYAYWKVRMRAEVREITKNKLYEVLAVQISCFSDLLRGFARSFETFCVGLAFQ